MRRDLRSRLRPMNFTDILDETIEIYKSNFVLLVGIAAFVYIPYFLIDSLIPKTEFNANPDPTQAITSGVLKFMFAILFFVIFHPIATGALTLAISERYLSKDISIKECYRRILQKKVILPFMGANLLVGTIVLSIIIAAVFISGLAFSVSFFTDNLGTGALVALIALCVIIGIAAICFFVHTTIRYTLVAPVFIIEKNGAVNSLRRSWALMKGNVGKALALLMLVGFVVSVISVIATGPSTAMSVVGAMEGKGPSMLWVAITTIISALISAVTAPLSSIVTILLYYDARIRKEGFDLELLAKELDEKTSEINAQDITALPQEQIPVQNHPTDSD